MKITFKKYEFPWFVVFCLTAIAAIIACNLWALFHGYSVVNDFLRIPPIGWMLILLNVLAGLILYVVKHRKETKRGGVRPTSAARSQPDCHGHEQPGHSWASGYYRNHGRHGDGTD